MAITLNGTTGITTPDVDSTADISVNGLTVGKGAGNVATNTAVGVSALAANTTGSQSTVVGYQAGYSNTTGDLSVAVGTQALYSNTTGVQNAAVGWKTLYLNTTGNYNNAFGLQALYSNTTGSYNAGFAHYALSANTTGSYNTAVGMQALTSNTTASYNTAVGYQAGYSQTTADYNTFIGYYAGRSTTGDQNTFIGKFAGNAVTTGTLNTIIGAYNGNQGGLDIRTSSNYIVLSDGGGTPRMYFNNSGYGFIPSMPVGGTANMHWSSSAGQLFVTSSSRRFKHDIVDYDKGLAEVMQMQPKYFVYNEEPNQKQRAGFIAEDFHDLGMTEFVEYWKDENNQDTPSEIGYSNMVAVLVKAIQELNAKVDAQAAEIAALKGQ